VGAGVGGIAVPAPQWYGKQGGNFFPVELTNELSAMSNQTGLAMSTADGMTDEGSRDSMVT